MENSFVIWYLNNIFVPKKRILMKIVQTFWSGGLSLRENAFGWLHPGMLS